MSQLSLMSPIPIMSLRNMAFALKSEDPDELDESLISFLDDNVSAESLTFYASVRGIWSVCSRW